MRSFHDALGKLTRHEATLMNAFTKTLQMLLLLQENRGNRKSEPVILEAVALPPAAYRGIMVGFGSRLPASS